MRQEHQLGRFVGVFDQGDLPKTLGAHFPVAWPIAFSLRRRLRHVGARLCLGIIRVARAVIDLRPRIYPDFADRCGHGRVERLDAAVMAAGAATLRAAPTRSVLACGCRRRLCVCCEAPHEPSQRGAGDDRLAHDTLQIRT